MNIFSVGKQILAGLAPWLNFTMQLSGQWWIFSQRNTRSVHIEVETSTFLIVLNYV
ncbi:hypothetical protein MKX03_026246, partial [Papaver bracteatum]